MDKKELEQAIADTKRVLELSEKRPVSTAMKAEMERQFGLEWNKHPELKKRIAEQEALETKAIRIRRQDLEKLEAQLKKVEV